MVVQADVAKFWRFIETMPTAVLAVGAGLLLLAPFVPEPHLVEKFRMFQSGALHKPLDIADVFVHLSGVIILLMHLGRRALRRPPTDTSPPDAERNG